MEIKCSLPTLLNQRPNIHSLLRERETNGHIQLIAAILKSSKDLEHVSLGLLSEQHGREEPVDLLQVLHDKKLFFSQMVQFSVLPSYWLVTGNVSIFFFSFCGHSILMRGDGRRCPACLFNERSLEIFISTLGAVSPTIVFTTTL